MRTKSLILAFGLCLLLLSSHAASAQVSVRIGGGYYPRAYYGPRYYYPPRPAVVYAVPPPPVYYAPAPVYYPPRPVYVAPRPYYRGRGYGRRW
ncbi:hypothetical protein [Hymenobacter ruricola]|uniref:Virulence factor n=1 Tax=Hymenobacter ruricola TaxID=2791023 RepID=A0ABS0I723_9BACT|nr:hypothetical protein [Hymenobacter ruricola]MBF9222750.1 hypothetical protein [Hymenobacter ruricola]